MNAEVTFRAAFDAWWAKYGTSRTVFGLIAICQALAIAIALRGLLFTPGLLMIGDHITPRADYFTTTLHAWDGSSHGGQPEAVNVSQLPVLSLFAAAAFLVGPGPADKLLVFVCFLLAAVSSTWFLRRLVPTAPPIVLGCAGFLYALNPETASRLASGHFAFLWAYALVPFLAEFALRKQSYAIVAAASMLTALIASASLQIGLASGVLYAIFLTLTAGNAWPRRIATAGAYVALTGLLSCWWVFPLVLIPGVHAPAPTMLETAALSARADWGHVLSLRAYWWPDFSDGLYGTGALTAIVLAACLWLAAAAGLCAYRWAELPRYARIAACLLAGVFSLQLIAHYAPAAFYWILHLPLASPYRDPDKLTFLAVLASVVLLAAASATFRNKWFVPAVGLIAMLTTVPWWGDGALGGRVKPIAESPDLRSAIGYMNLIHPDGFTLWLPAGPYLSIRNGPAGIQDPARFESRIPTLNPYLDAAYDFTPGVSSALEQIERRVWHHDDLGLGPQLGRMGVQYLVFRTDEAPYGQPFLTRETVSLPPADFQLVRRFRDIFVYRVVAYEPGPFLVGAHRTLATDAAVRTADGILPATQRLIYAPSDTPDPYQDSEVVDLSLAFDRLLLSLRETPLTSGGGYGWYYSPDDASWISMGQRTGALAYALPPHHPNEFVLRIAGPVGLYVVGTDAGAAESIDGSFASGTPHTELFRIPAAARILTIASNRPGIAVSGAWLADPVAVASAMHSAAVEMSGRYVAYVIPGTQLYGQRSGAQTSSNWIGPLITVPAQSPFAVGVTGRNVSHVTLRVRSSGRASEIATSLTCRPDACHGTLDLPRGSARLALSYTGNVAALSLTPPAPPTWSDNGTVASIAPVANWRFIVWRQSRVPGWTLACRGAVATPSDVNAPQQSYILSGLGRNCVLRFAPAFDLQLGRVISLATLLCMLGAFCLAAVVRVRIKADDALPDGAP